MILNNVTVPVDKLNEPTYMTSKLSDKGVPFPILAIGRGSYIVGAQIQSMLNFDVKAGIHNIQIGAFCSLADDITFMVNMNHDYMSVTTSASSFVATPGNVSKTTRKGQILIQNDVWVGHGATIMSGITVHNGAVVAANANVTKDVPPYAIVGGNPAKVIKYRFTEEQIADLQAIAWWDWSDKVIAARKVDFSLPIEEFISKYRCSHEELHRESRRGGTVCLFFSDFTEPYPIWEKVVRAYCGKFGSDPNTRLIFYIPKDNQTNASLERLETCLCSIYSGEGDIVVQLGVTRDESELFAISDYYITNRSLETVRRSCIADKYGVKTLSGLDDPLFWNIERDKK